MPRLSSIADVILVDGVPAGRSGLWVASPECRFNARKRRFQRRQQLGRQVPHRSSTTPERYGRHRRVPVLSPPDLADRKRLGGTGEAYRRATAAADFIGSRRRSCRPRRVWAIVRRRCYAVARGRTRRRGPPSSSTWRGRRHWLGPTTSRRPAPAPLRVPELRAMANRQQTIDLREMAVDRRPVRFPRRRRITSYNGLRFDQRHGNV